MVKEHEIPIIELRNVWRSFEGLHVLCGIDLAVRRGSTTVVIGPSGCGKSVLLKHIVGLMKPDAGQVFFDGTETTHLSERALVTIRRRIGVVFQGGALFDSMDVEQNVCFPLVEHDLFSPDERHDRCREALRMVGLDGMQNKVPAKLSGGQKKRVALARAIVIDPDVILYDEPTTGLDPIRADLINELIIRLQQQLRTTAVVVTHDIASARKVGDRVAMLHSGRFIADAAPEALADIDDDRVRRFVEGRASDEELKELQVGHLAAANHRPDPADKAAQ